MYVQAAEYEHGIVIEIGTILGHPFKCFKENVHTKMRLVFPEKWKWKDEEEIIFQKKKVGMIYDKIVSTLSNSILLRCKSWDLIPFPVLTLQQNIEIEVLEYAESIFDIGYILF